MLVLIPAPLHIYHVLSADTTVSQVQQTVLLVHKENMAHTKEPLYAWIVRRGNSDLLPVALLWMGAKIVPLVSTALQTVRILAPLVVRQNINPPKDSLRVLSAQVWGKSETQSEQGV